MSKKILAAAIAAAIVAPAAVMADATIYGKVRMAVESVDMNDSTQVEIKSYASRIGVKGSEDLGDGLAAVYKLEFGVNIADTAGEFSGSAPTVTSRNAYVGLKGNWGTLLVGRHDTPLKMSTGSLDYFGDTAGDNNANYTEDLQDRRANGTVAYVSPAMGGLTIAAALVPGENAEADGLTDAYSVAAIYGNNGLHASVAYEAGDSDIDTLGGMSDLSQTRVGLGYKADGWKASVVWENVDLDDVDFTQDSYVVAGGFDFGNNTVKAKYFDVEDSHDGFAVGLDHNFSKRTQAYLVYTDTGYDNDADVSILGVGLNHNF